MINSSLKFYNGNKNYFLIEKDLKLAKELSSFFSQHDNAALWKINTHRQETTKALRNTESIMLRQISFSKVMESMGNTFVNTTAQCNQIMELEDSEVYHRFSLFKKMMERIDKFFLGIGATEIDYGRIFFSKLKAESNIDEHTDKGKYFSYYDRFHFVIETPENCVFHINENIYLQEGGFYWVNNHVPHWLRNDGSKDRINLIIDARLK